MSPADRPDRAAGARPQNQAPIGFAHRGGASRRGLQNTLDAFRSARSLGASAVESDVALTADGVPVLVHPRLLARLRRPVSSLRRDQLPGHVPTVEEMYRELGSAFDVALDMTAPAAVVAVVDIARRLGDPSRLWLTYWRVGTLAAWRERYPDVRLVFPTLLLRTSAVQQRCAALHAAGVDAINLFHWSCTPARVSAAHHSGLLVFGWGARSGSAARRTLRAGADGVFCDDVTGMVTALADQARLRGALSAGG